MKKQFGTLPSSNNPSPQRNIVISPTEGRWPSAGISFQVVISKTGTREYLNLIIPEPNNT